MQRLNHRRACGPKAGFIHLIAAVVSNDGHSDRSFETGHILRGEQTSVALHVCADALSYWTAVTIIACSRQPSEPPLSCCGFFCDHYRAQRAREIRLDKHVAYLRHLAAGHKDSFCVGPLREDGTAVFYVLNAQLIDRKS